GPPPGTAYTTKTTYLDPVFNKPGDQAPPYTDKNGRWRVGVRWTSSPGQYPIRWGFFKNDKQELQPGQQVTIRGTIRIEQPIPRDVDFYATVEMGGTGFSGDYGQTHVHVAY
ncbi:MAG: hypothetical protein ACYDAG_14315, partial [Chloroflexota bacterium]